MGKIFKNPSIEGTCVAVVGLGYVGLPLAEAFSHHFKVIGYDANADKIKCYQLGKDVTEELGDDTLKSCGIVFTNQPELLAEANFIIVAVPTPIHGDKTPDLSLVKSASKTVGGYLKQGSVVVYESTVYPGVTEEICMPILEKYSGLRAGEDFKVGYSPERINPGDKKHRLKNITKIVSGMDEQTLRFICSVYEIIVDEIYAVPSIKVAEAAKLVENAQRDINIAFMNELAMVFHRIGIDTAEVVKAMNTKWNALGFCPGLVGGHCIGVDPYFFVYQAENLGIHSQLISSGRRINNGMSEYICQETLRLMIKSGISMNHANIALLGMSFKENCPDLRNSRSLDIYSILKEYGFNLTLVDPVVNKDGFYRTTGLSLSALSDVHEMDCVMVLVAHDRFANMTIEELKSICRKDSPLVLIDVKSIYARREMEAAGFLYWNL